MSEIYELLPICCSTRLLLNIETAEQELLVGDLFKREASVNGRGAKPHGFVPD